MGAGAIAPPHFVAHTRRHTPALPCPPLPCPPLPCLACASLQACAVQVGHAPCMYAGGPLHVCRRAHSHSVHACAHAGCASGWRTLHGCTSLPSLMGESACICANIHSPICSLVCLPVGTPPPTRTRRAAHRAVYVYVCICTCMYVHVQAHGTPRGHAGLRSDDRTPRGHTEGPLRRCGAAPHEACACACSVSAPSTTSDAPACVCGWCIGTAPVCIPRHAPHAPWSHSVYPPHGG